MPIIEGQPVVTCNAKIYEIALGLDAISKTAKFLQVFFKHRTEFKYPFASMEIS
jgi:hypothetical protein